MITDHLVKIEYEVISNILSLLVFRMLVDPLVYSPEYDEARILAEVECLEHVSELGLILSSTTAVQKLLNSHKLQMSIKQLKLAKLTDQASVSLRKLPLRRMEHLETLELWNCEDLIKVEVENENEETQTIYQSPASPEHMLRPSAYATRKWNIGS